MRFFDANSGAEPEFEAVQGRAAGSTDNIKN